TRKKAGMALARGDRFAGPARGAHGELAWDRVPASPQAVPGTTARGRAPRRATGAPAWLDSRRALHVPLSRSATAAAQRHWRFAEGDCTPAAGVGLLRREGRPVLRPPRCPAER